MKFLSMDSPFMAGLNKISDLIIINLLTVAFCIPIITIGPAMTAMHYQVLKIVRDEECYVIKGYFKSFKENFKQATIIWLILLAIILILIADFRWVVIAEMQPAMLYESAIVAVMAFVIFTLTFVFAIQAKFVNTVKNTMKNALVISVAKFPKTILMIIIHILPFIFAWVMPFFIPLVLVCCFTLPAYFDAKMYDKFFQKMEDKIREQLGLNEEENKEEDEDVIFHDQLDPVLQDKNMD